MRSHIYIANYKDNLMDTFANLSFSLRLILTQSFQSIRKATLRKCSKSPRENLKLTWFLRVFVFNKTVQPYINSTF